MKYLRKITALTVATLWPMQVALAQYGDGNRAANDGMAAALGVLGQAQNTIGQYTNSMNQSQMFTPRTRPSKVFPGCQIPLTKDRPPQNACGPTAPIENDQMHAQQVQMAKLSFQKVDFFDNMLLNTTNSKSGMGLSCMRTSMLALDRRLTKDVSDFNKFLDSYIENVNKQKQILEDRRQEVETYNSVLNGGPIVGKDQAEIGQVFEKAMGGKCQNILDNSVLRSLSSKGGLQSIQDQLTTLNPKTGQSLLAQSAQVSSRDFEGEVRNMSKNLRNSMKEYGLDSGALGEVLANYPTSMQNAAKLAFRQRNRKLERTKGLIGQTPQGQKFLDGLKNSPCSSMNQDCLSHLENFSSKAWNNFVNPVVNNCVNDSSGTIQTTSGRGVFQTIYDQLGDSSSQEARGLLRARFYATFMADGDNQDKSMNQRIIEFRNYENEIMRSAGEASFIRWNTLGDAATPRISDVLSYNHDQCVTRFNRNQAGSTRTPGARSERAKIEDSVNALNNFKAELDKALNNTSDFMTSMNDYLKCTPQTKLQGTCSPGDLDPNSNGFCVAKAVTCSASVQNCNKQAEKAIGVFRSRRKAAAAKFNLAAKGIIYTHKLQNLMLKKRTEDFSKMIGERFETMGIEMPAGLTLAEPELKDAYGTRLMGGGNLQDLFKKMTTNLSKMKDVLQETKQKALDAADREMKLQVSAMKANQKAWENFNQMCIKSSLSYKKAKDQKNAKRKKKRDKDYAEAAQVCLQYEGMITQPNAKALCGDSGMQFDELNQKIAKTARLYSDPGRMMTTVRQYKMYCNGVDIDEDKDDAMTLESACNISGSLNGFLKDNKKSIGKQLSRHGISEDDINKFLNGKLSPSKLEKKIQEDKSQNGTEFSTPLKRALAAYIQVRDLSSKKIVIGKKDLNCGSHKDKPEYTEKCKVLQSAYDSSQGEISYCEAATETKYQELLACGTNPTSYHSCSEEDIDGHFRKQNAIISKFTYFEGVEAENRLSGIGEQTIAACQGTQLMESRVGEHPETPDFGRAMQDRLPAGINEK